MWLIVGLGNPGPKYALTRHNIGFQCLDLYSQSINNPPWNEEHKAHICKVKINDIPVIFAKPMTYMNKSGESVQALLHYYKISLENLIVVHDELDQPFGKMKIQKNRGHGGHNGIRSISELLGTQDYIRLKLGIGRPPHPNMEVADYVLQKFSQEEQSQLADFLNKGGDALEAIIFDGLQKASTKFNT
ncbi:MAG: peptidyl-tRNA hydrolase [Oligoflexia bacterium]|nr:MAG: peptidyl-tRNA hydrolase [Oligoflexia bacterium]